ncbi:ABC transporter substrate-binding protein [Paenibacillus paeoniae]|uniref:Extracellular solute-binding protein n=1 Tax=Paenibacillus paeoniae TaxID=2292705 RepID=A0A371PKY4_9BACL|nr:extracellular solute-binding protein [Paenibacillus paeoniae]REK76773.1 extracellular solute-binding protein [Paenibacillus paeoniae]
MKKTKLAAMLVACFMLLTVMGCGAKSGSETGGNATNAPTATPAQSKEPAQEGLTGEFEIQYFVGGYGDAWWLETIEQFQQANPKLNIKQSAGAVINDQMKPRWIQGDPPDVVYIDGAGSNPRQMIEDDQLLDITEWIQEAKNANSERLLDVLISQPEVYGGKVYNLPLVFGAYGNFYDQALFEKNGWKVPTDYNSFLALSEEIKASGISPYVHTGVYPEYIHGGFLFPAIISANGDNTNILVDMGEMKEGVFQSEPILKALEKLSEISSLGYIDKASSALNHTDSQMLFLQHQSAFIPNGLWLESEMKNDTPEDFKFAYIPSVTQSNGGKYVAIPYTATVAIAKKAKNVEAAKAFIEFAFTKQHSLNFAEKTGALMNVKADLESSTASDVVKGAMNFYSDGSTLVAPVVEFNPDVKTEMNNATVALTLGKITPQQWGERVEAAAAKARK